MPLLCCVSHCKFISQKFGVCNRHKKYSFYYNDPNFINDIEYYRYLYHMYQAEIYILEENGFRNIPDFETLLILPSIKDNDCHSDLTPIRSNNPMISLSLNYITELIQNLNKCKDNLFSKYDHILIQNNITRIHHSYLLCKCSICKLQSSCY